MEIVTGKGDITASNEAKEDWKEKKSNKWNLNK